MCEKSQLGAGGVAPGAPEAGAPMRPPDKDNRPSTLSLKYSEQTMRREVIPPWLWPASQKVEMFSLPNCAMTVSTMFCR
jgi:hypothetical protein